MATFINISGAQLYLNDEFGLPVCFAIGESKTGLSNYMSRYTSAVATGENVVLRLVGALDPDTMHGTIPVAAIEEENVAVRPSDPDAASQGVYWGVPGKSNTAIVAGYSDAANTSTRLQRVVFNTANDLPRRQIDTRYLDVKPASTLAPTATHVDAAEPIDGNTADILLDTVSSVIEPNGRRATAADCANLIYGSLLTEGQYYTAFGSILCHDASKEDETIGFALRGVSTATFTPFTSTIEWDTLALAIKGGGTGNTLTMTIAHGAGGDTVAATVYFAQAVSTATRANALGLDANRGWYSMTANATTQAVAGVLLLTEDGALQIITGASPTFVAWS